MIAAADLAAIDAQLAAVELDLALQTFAAVERDLSALATALVTYSRVSVIEVAS